MRAKETILIHLAARGTGQAAIQIAQMLGANVFATAIVQQLFAYASVHEQRKLCAFQ